MSITSRLVARSEKPFVCSRWSTSRPGVATMTCGRFASASACAIMSIPPTTHAAESPIALWVHKMRAYRDHPGTKVVVRTQDLFDRVALDAKLSALLSLGFERRDVLGK